MNSRKIIDSLSLRQGVSEKMFTFRDKTTREVYAIEADTPATAIRALTDKHGEKPYEIVSISESDSGWQPLRYFKGKVPYPEMYDVMAEFEMEHGMSRFKRYENDEIKDIYLANDFKGYVYLWRYDQEKWEPHYDERRAYDTSLEDDSFL